ncbi:MAG: porin [Paracoccus sp. (in: a-proteobacteria)]
MKKVLLATTALALTTGVAAAEITLSGDARMGLVYDGNDAQFGSRARIRFTATGETDGGLSFGASFRVDHENAGGGLASSGTAGAVYVSGTYGKLSMGDVVSASEAAIGDLYAVGYTDTTFAGDLDEISYLTADGNNLDQGPNVLYEYSISGFNVYASMSDASDNAWPGATGTDGAVWDPVAQDWRPADNNDDTDIAWSVGGSYDGTFTGGTYSVGLGYGKHGDAKEIVAGGEVTYGAFSGKAIYADYKNRPGIDFRIGDDAAFEIDSANYEYDKAYGLSLSYEYNAFLFKGFYRRDEAEAVVVGVDDENFDTFGIGVDYDLGGGATLAAGVVDSDWIEDTVADAGIRFSF